MSDNYDVLAQVREEKRELEKDVAEAINRLYLAEQCLNKEKTGEALSTVVGTRGQLEKTVGQTAEPKNEVSVRDE